MPNYDFSTARILVVDDDPAKLRLIRELLTLEGYRKIQTIEDPALAVRDFGEINPDLVILDLHMDPFDGFEFLNRIQPDKSPNSYVPVLVLTGDVTRQVKERALACGAMDFLAKPYNVTEILLRIRNLLYTRKLHCELQAERDALEERVRRRTEEVLRTQDEMLIRLATVAEFHDDATGDHAKRVGELVRLTALELGIDQAEAELFGKAALLHDLGKVAVPDAILLKPARLEEGEQAQVKRHAKIGGDILKGSSSRLLMIAERIARYHHERWNGTGYEGLVGTDIPLEARITAVADVYDALTHLRPYKEAWTQQISLAEIEKHSGTQFDPQVVEAFLRAASQNTPASAPEENCVR